MTSHTNAVNRTTRYLGSSGSRSSVGVPPTVFAPGFMALSPAWQQFTTHLELGALPTAVPCARLHVRQVLWEWGLGELAEVSEAVVSELVPNAYETTIRNQLPTPIRLRLSSNGQQALIEVWDADPTPPRPAVFDINNLPLAYAEGGRGLLLVAALSERWSCYRLSQAGKVVWATSSPTGG
jgi:anti-sigma regulatory factor (Ser/Thr protein kinase)